MKIFLVVLAVWFTLAWMPLFVKSWAMGIRMKWKKKRAKRHEKWMYEI